MPSARRITVDFVAGTAKFNSDLEKSKAKVVDFGKATTSNMVASSAAIRLLEGNIGTNTRALSRWLTQIQGVGPLLQAAFPVVGLVVFAGALEMVGSKVYKFFKDMQEAPKNIANAFREIDAPLKLTNADLDVTNAKLENQLAKLQGHRENTLKEALLEAHAAAMKLGEALEKDLRDLDKLMKEQNVGILNRIFGQAGTSDLKKLADDLRTGVTAVETGAGNDADKLRRVVALYTQAIKEVGDKLKSSPGVDVLGSIAAGGVPQVQDLGARNESIRDLRTYLQDELDRINKETLSGELKGKVAGAEAANENAKPGQLVADALKQIADRATEAQAKLANLGKPESIQILAKSAADSQREIDKLNKALEKYHTTVARLGQEDNIALQESITDLTVADAEWGVKLDANRVKVEERIASLNAMTAALGKGYEATKAIAVQTRVAAEMGERYNEASEQATTAQSTLTARYAQEYEAEHASQIAETVDKLQEQTRAENLLAIATTQGSHADAVAALNAKLIEIARHNLFEKAMELTKAETELFNAQQRRSSDKELASINLKVAATQRLISAQGQEAKLAAEVANVRAAAEDKYGAKSGVGSAAANEELVKQQLPIHEEADKLVHSYQDQLDIHQKVYAEILKEYAAGADILSVNIAIRAVNQQILSDERERALQLGTLQGQVHAFFLDMQSQALKASTVIYDALHSALDKVSDQLAKLFTGQKTSFAKMFQGLGEELVKSSIKGLATKGLAEIGQHLPGKLGDVLKGATGKPDGTKEHPWWVMLAGAAAGPGGVGGVGTASAPFGGLPAPPGLATSDILGSTPSAISRALGQASGPISSLIGLLSAGGGAASAASDAAGGLSNIGTTLGLAGLAEGGSDLGPGMYMVGERGAEILNIGDRASGHASVTPIDRAGGGGAFYSIDARGAQLGVENRISRGIEASHDSAISQSVRVQHERTQRTPQRTAA